jgi:hypothetical protein
MIACSICGARTDVDGTSLFRIGAKGDRDAEWRCRAHTPHSFEVDPIVDEIVSVIEEENFHE